MAMDRSLQLKAIEGPLSGQTFSIGAEELVIGRGESCGLRISDPGVSREHAGVFLRNGAVWVRDMGSRNGVSVNGKKIARPKQIGPGDKIGVGEVQVFEIAWNEPEEVAAEPLPGPPEPSGMGRGRMVALVVGIILAALGVAAAVGGG
jgi:pSer/pThr/pTyr-binding forkhead associated (FHA) protein